jgi:hypothetical protein
MCPQVHPSCALSCPLGLPHLDVRSRSSAELILRLRPPLRVRDANGVNGRRSPWSDGSSAETGWEQAGVEVASKQARRRKPLSGGLWTACWSRVWL